MRGTTTPATSARNGNTIAEVSQLSRQLWQCTPCIARHARAIDAFCHQGGDTDADSAPVVQTSRHAAQNVQAPWLKSMVGYPPLPRTMIFSGQAAVQSPQRVQASRKSWEAIAQGGLTGGIPPSLPRNSARRLRSIDRVTHLTRRWTDDQLKYPNQQTVRTDDTNRQHRHDHSSKK